MHLSGTEQGRMRIALQDAAAGTPENKAQGEGRASVSPDTTPPARRPRFGVWVRPLVPAHVYAHNCPVDAQARCYTMPQMAFHSCALITSTSCARGA